jgi:hypothetical protein
LGRPDAIALTSRTDGVTVVPLRRNSVTSSSQVRSVWSLSAASVSVWTVAYAVAWPVRDVRLTAPPSSVSSEAHRPRTYHPAVPSSATARTRASSQDPSGVVAFHDATSSVKACPGSTTGDVQVAVS